MNELCPPREAGEGLCQMPSVYAFVVVILWFVALNVCQACKKRILTRHLFFGVSFHGQPYSEDRAKAAFRSAAKIHKWAISEP